MNIYVANLSDTVTEADLSRRFGKFGHVNSVHIALDLITGEPKGYAMVEMADDDAEQAIRELDGSRLKRQPMRVSASQFNVDRRGGRAVGNFGAGGKRRW